MASEAQNNANRENAEKSNGPTSNDGFERCKASPVTHGLFAKLGRLITDSEEAYEKCIKGSFLRLQPANESEEALVEEIAQNEWKLKRATLWEQSVVAKGIWDNRHFFNDEAECPAEIRDVIVLGQVLQTDWKIISNMNSEFARTRRSVEKSIAGYEKVRRDRELIETAQRNIAMQSIMGKSSDPVVKHPTVGTLYPFPFLIARLEFVNGVGRHNVFAFDRVWTDPKVKPPSIHFDWGEFAAKMAA